MDQMIQFALLPLGAFWVIFNSLISAGKFVNEMRETVIIGIKDGSPLTLEHRKNVFLDWRLSMIGVVTSTFSYAIITFWIGIHIKDSFSLNYAWLPIMIVGVLSISGGFLYVGCSVSDWKLMSKTLKEVEHSGT